MTFPHYARTGQGQLSSRNRGIFIPRGYDEAPHPLLSYSKYTTNHWAPWKLPPSSLTPSLLRNGPGHIPIDAGAIDSSLREIPQKPYTKGLGKEKNANLRIPYFPSGFTVSTVASGDISEVVDPDASIITLDNSLPAEKKQLYVEFCNPAYTVTSHTKQKRVVSTRGGYASLIAEEIKNIVSGIPNFPYKLDQIKVVSIDVRSKGTVQPRLFVDGFVMASQQENDSLGILVAEVVTGDR